VSLLTEKPSDATDTVPKETALALVKPEPEMVTLVPPAIDPSFGLTFVTIGIMGA
jgi:hypothetical protein